MLHDPQALKEAIREVVLLGMLRKVLLILLWN